MRKRINNNLITFILFSLLLAIINGYIFNYINNNFVHYSHTDNGGLNNLSKNSLIMLTIFVAPIIETWIFQYTSLIVLKEVFKVENDKICILIMSLVFSQFHWYSWLYVVMIFFSGLILNNFYITALRKYKYSFLLTVLLHSIYNLYGFLFVV